MDYAIAYLYVVHCERAVIPLAAWCIHPHTLPERPSHIGIDGVAGYRLEPGNSLVS